MNYSQQEYEQIIADYLAHIATSLNPKRRPDSSAEEEFEAEEIITKKIQSEAISTSLQDAQQSIVDTTKKDFHALLLVERAEKDLYRHYKLSMINSYTPEQHHTNISDLVTYCYEKDLRIHPQLIINLYAAKHGINPETLLTKLYKSNVLIMQNKTYLQHAREPLILTPAEVFVKKLQKDGIGPEIQRIINAIETLKGKKLLAQDIYDQESFKDLKISSETIRKAYKAHFDLTLKDLILAYRYVSKTDPSTYLLEILNKYQEIKERDGALSPKLAKAISDFKDRLEHANNAIIDSKVNPIIDKSLDAVVQQANVCKKPGYLKRRVFFQAYHGSRALAPEQETNEKITSHN
ncbi:MAG: hypothetical protein H2069_07060 [Legionella sp.]|nr:hypothetical protein [Legionella sp.]